MLDLLAGMQIARKASEQQFAYGAAHSRDGRPQKRRSPVRHLLFFRRSRHEDRAQTPPSVAAHEGPQRARDRERSMELGGLEPPTSWVGTTTRQVAIERLAALLTQPATWRPTTRRSQTCPREDQASDG